LPALFFCPDAEARLKRWNLVIDDAPAEGTWNMAVDEFLFRSLADRPETSVRFYRWTRPTVSLGYSQDFARVVDAAYCRENGIDIVRRITGGKLVLHDREVTYSVISSDTGTFSENLGDSYRLISRGLMAGLSLMGLEASLAGPPPQAYVRGALPCFSHPGLDEVETAGLKVIGSAQKRVGAKFLQHGSIPLVKDEALLRSVSFLDREASGLRMTSLSEALGRPVDFDPAVRSFVSGLEEFFGVEFSPLAFGDEDRAAIRRLQELRYARTEWTVERRASGLG
jgi:lipoate-protein ligase A